MSEPAITRKQYTDALRIIAEQRKRIKSLKRKLLIEQCLCDELKHRVVTLQDQIAVACV